VIPEIEITCGEEIFFINSITVEQYKRYAKLMEKNGSDRILDVMFFNKKIVQAVFGNRLTLEKLGKMDAMEFMEAVKGIHFIMQDIISEKLLNIVEVEVVEREESAFDEYDMENGYKDDVEPEENPWRSCGEILDRVVKIAIRVLKNSYSQCMKEDILSLLEYLKFELDTLDENQ